jgi:undecaprenyl-phosphate galactose phosphotransferase
MGRHAPAFCACILLAADVLAFTSAGLVGLAAVHHADPGSAHAAAWALPIPAASLLCYLALHGRYSERIPFWSEFRLTVSTSCLGAALVTLWLVASGQTAQFLPSVLAFALFPLFATATIYGAKSLLSRGGLWTLDIVLVCEDAVAAVIEGAIRSAPSLGYRLIRRVPPAAVAAAPAGGALRSIMQRSGARRVIIALGAQQKLYSAVMEAARNERAHCIVLAETTEGLGTSCEAMSFLSHDSVLMALSQDRSRRLSRLAKICFDVVAAVLLLIFFAPLFAAVAAVNWCGGGPVFFAHRRVGLAGRPFHCLKFRTMVVDGERVLQKALAADPALAREWADTRKLQDDPRVTRIGRILRKTSIDELPQLINVLRLEMSLVGPRPIVQDEVHKFGEDVVHYYSTRPGITGLWQVSGRSNTSFERRVQLDVWYATNQTLWNDFAVLLRTIPAVLVRDGAY